MNLDGDLFLNGHPAVRDNELTVPDLEPTIETGNFLVKLKAALDGDEIREQARAALRLDIGERLKSVRDKLSTDLGFGSGQGCVKATADKIEVTVCTFTRPIFASMWVSRAMRTSTYRVQVDGPSATSTQAGT